MTIPNARHREAAEIVLAPVPQANASLCVALRAIADAWDNVENGNYDPKLITGLSVQLFKCLDRLGIEADHDVWEDLSRELTRGCRISVRCATTGRHAGRYAINATPT